LLLANPEKIQKSRKVTTCQDKSRQVTASQGKSRSERKQTVSQSKIVDVETNKLDRSLNFMSLRCTRVENPGEGVAQIFALGVRAFQTK
jgi:hypothetical protein